MVRGEYEYPTDAQDVLDDAGRDGGALIRVGTVSLKYHSVVEFKLKLGKKTLYKHQSTFHGGNFTQSHFRKSLI